jgi:NAD(P)-dependent dehydrogenase (short-subunit alcohol dehydrogenase family)
MGSAVDGTFAAEGGSLTLVGRDPTKLADIVLFLASPCSAALNGAIISVDGGCPEGLH